MIDGINQLPAPLFLPKGHDWSQPCRGMVINPRTSGDFDSPMMGDMTWDDPKPQSVANPKYHERYSIDIH